MINTQLGRRNLPPAQRLAVMDKFKKKIQEQAKSTQGTRTDLTSSPNGEKVKSTHTDKELAKMAGVGTGTVAYDTKEEVMEWMLDIQLGRRNLSPIQRIAVAEKYRPIYERQAQQNLKEGGRKGGLANSSKPSQNSSKASNIENKIDVRAKLATVAGVSTDTYSKGKKILDSDNETLKQEVLSGEKSINAGYKELTQNKKEKYFL